MSYLLLDYSCDTTSTADCTFIPLAKINPCFLKTNQKSQVWWAHTVNPSMWEEGGGMAMYVNSKSAYST